MRSQQKRGFVLSWWMGIPILVYIILVALVYRPEWGTASGMGLIVGAAGGGLLAAWLAGWLAFWIGGRSRLVGHIAFGFILLAAVGGQLSARGLQTKARANLIGLSTAIRDESALLQDAAKRFEELGGAEVTTMKTREAVDERLDLLRQIIRENERLLGRLRGLEQEADALLIKLGIHQEEKRQEHIAEMFNGIQRDQAMREREFDGRVFAALADLLAFLQREYGQWRIEGPRALFENDAQLAEYQSLATAVTAAASNPPRAGR